MTHPMTPPRVTLWHRLLCALGWHSLAETTAPFGHADDALVLVRVYCRRCLYHRTWVRKA